MEEKKCRVCLEQNSSFLKSIFCIDDDSELKLSYAEMINLSISSSVQIVENDGLPNKICSQCFPKVSEFHKFKLEIEKNQIILISQTSSLNKHSNNIPISMDSFQDFPETIVIKKEEEQCENEEDLDAGQISAFVLLPNDNKRKRLGCNSNSGETEGKRLNNINVPVKNGSIDDKKDEFECEKCKITFRNKRNLRMHLLIHSDDKPYECENCNKIFISKKTFEEHLVTHAQVSYVCQYCNKKFGNQKNLQTHLSIHTNEIYNCEECNKSYSTRKNLNVHLQSHKGQKVYECKYCTKPFIYFKSLKEHLLTHPAENYNKINDPEVSLECKECNKKFSRKSVLRDHLLLHAGEKLFKCEHCSKAFVNNRYLKRHSLVHMDVTSFRCDHCEKVFNSNSSYQEHINTCKKDVKIPSSNTLQSID